MLPVLNSCPISARRDRSPQLPVPANLRRRHVGDVVTNREFGDWLLPNFPREGVTVDLRRLHNNLEDSFEGRALVHFFFERSPRSGERPRLALGFLSLGGSEIPSNTSPACHLPTA
jgi:hypothetical protein